MPTTNRAAVLSWCGAAISPFLIYSVLLLHLDPVTGVILFLLGLGALTGALRRQPAAVLGVLVFVLAVVALDGDRGALQLWIEVVLTVVILGVVGLLAAVRRRRVSVTGTVLALTAGLLLIAAEKSFAMVSLSVAVVLATITAWVIGDSIRQRTRFAAAQRVQSEAAAVESERLRIARELHDMIAHSIGVIAIQAGMGRRMIGTQPAAAQEALAAIEDTSRETLAALRRMLGTLRRSGPGPGGAVALAPAPGLADLDSLVTRTRDAGVRVEIEWLG
ncbi:MAG TPA: histidine kinase dimerization/phosphoacceptor domain-containing protein, partial [Actinoplanes sp.]|nr:histidine kinase dimerization/phosphoacceptor domain-containing protein [Actinoplanes sp.]